MQTTSSFLVFDLTIEQMPLCQRFRDELNYEHATAFAIQEKGEGSRTMYYMVHASDHIRAVELMSQAYRKVGESRETDGIQLPLRW